MQLELWSAWGWSGEDLCKLALEGLKLGWVGLTGGRGEGQIFRRYEGKGAHTHDRAIVEDEAALLRQARKRVRRPRVIVGCLGRGYCRCRLQMTGG